MDDFEWQDRQHGPQPRKSQNTMNPIEQPPKPLLSSNNSEIQVRRSYPIAQQQQQHQQQLQQPPKKNRLSMNDKLQLCEKMQEELHYQYEETIPEMFQNMEQLLVQVRRDFDTQTNGLEDIQHKLEDLHHDAFIPAWCNYIATNCRMQYPVHHLNTDGSTQNEDAHASSTDENPNMEIMHQEIKQFINQVQGQLHDMAVSSSMPLLRDVDDLLNETDSWVKKHNTVGQLSSILADQDGVD